MSRKKKRTLSSPQPQKADEPVCEAVPVDTPAEAQPEGEENKHESAWSVRKVLICGGLLILFAWLLLNFNKIFSLLGKGLKLFSPFLVGCAIAYILNLLLCLLEKAWTKIFAKSKKKLAGKLKRPVCLVLSILLVLVILFLIVFMILPSVRRTVLSIIDNIPNYVDTLRGWWNTFSSFASEQGVTLPEFSLNADKIVSFAEKWITEAGQNFISHTISATSSIFSGVFNLFLSIAFSIYLLAQKEKIGAVLTKWIHAFVPEKKADRFLGFTAKTDYYFTKFITGQLSEAVIIGVLCFFGMLILRIPYAPVCSVLVGFTALIPIVGAFVGTAVGAFLILLVDPMKAVWFVVFIIILQQLENNLIYPRVVGKSVGLPGILVLIAVTIGGNMFGVVGMLIGVPVTAVLYTYFKELVEKRIQKKKESEAPDPVE